MNPLYYILLILISIFSNPDTNEPVRLQKQQTKLDLKRELDCFIGRNFNFIALAVMIGVILFFVWFCFFITGAAAVESGNMYNHMVDVI